MVLGIKCIRRRTETEGDGRTETDGRSVDGDGDGRTLGRRGPTETERDGIVGDLTDGDEYVCGDEYMETETETDGDGRTGGRRDGGRGE